MSVAHLLRTHTSRELTDWEAFGNIEPFGGPIEDYRAGIAAAVYVNSHRKEGTAPVNPTAFYGHYAELQKAEVEDSDPDFADKVRALLNRVGKSG